MARLTPSAFRPSSWVVVLVTLCLPALVLAGLVVASSARNPTAAAGRVGPVLASVTRSDTRAQATVSVTVAYAAGPTWVSGSTGVVTQAPVRGARLANGSVAFAVNDRHVLAMVADAPLWRPLERGDRGDDVRRLATFLMAAGVYRGPATTVVDAPLARAISDFNARLGYPSAPAVFDPARVLWVGPLPTTVGDALVSAGTTVAPGAPIASGPRSVSAVKVMEPPGGIAATGDFTGGATLVVGSAAVSYRPGSGAVTDHKGVASIRSALAPADTGAAIVQAARPKPVRLVPASALVTGSDGMTCVYAAPDATPTAVTPVGGGVATAQLPADFPLATVLANPGSVRLGHPCGS